MNDLTPLPSHAVTLTIAGEPRSVYEFAALARDIAVALQSEATILETHNVSHEDYEILKGHPFFVRMLDSMRKEWNAVSNTVERTSIEAAFTFEQLMPKLYARANDPETPFAQVLEYAKVLARAGGIGEGRAAGNAADKFAITINLGADQQLKVEAPRRPSPLFDLDATATEVPTDGILSE